MCVCVCVCVCVLVYRPEVSNSVTNSLRICLRQIASLNFCTGAHHWQLACLSTQLNWCCLCSPFFQKAQMSGRLCVNLFIFCRNFCTHKDSKTKTSTKTSRVLHHKGHFIYPSDFEVQCPSLSICVLSAHFSRPTSLRLFTWVERSTFT